MAKGRFGGDKYKPHQLGPEPAAPLASPELTSSEPSAPVLAPEGQKAASPAAPVAPAAADQPVRKARPTRTASTEAVPDIKVPYSSRISYAADLQLRALAKEGHTQVDLIAEALNLLFKKHGLDEVA
jgi:hypothetical protein